MRLADFNQDGSKIPGLGDGYLNRGAVLVNQKRYAEARADFLQALSLTPYFQPAIQAWNSTAAPLQAELPA